MIDADRKIWSLKEDRAKCIVDVMKLSHGMKGGRFVNESKSKDTSYRFDFSTGKPDEMYSYRIELDNDGLYVTTDMGDTDLDDEDETAEINRRLDLFFDAIRRCVRSLGMASKSVLGDWAADARAVKKNQDDLFGIYVKREEVAEPKKKEDKEVDELAEAVGKVSLKKEGGRTRRQKKRRATRRRKTHS